jgi:hypothetical protein
MEKKVKKVGEVLPSDVEKALRETGLMDGCEYIEEKLQEAYRTYYHFMSTATDSHSKPNVEKEMWDAAYHLAQYIQLLEDIRDNLYPEEGDIPSPIA